MLTPRGIYTAEQILEMAEVPHRDDEGFYEKNSVIIAGITVFNKLKSLRVPEEGKVVIQIGQEEYNIKIE